MRLWVIGNAAIDETMKVDAWPVPGMSVLAESSGRDLGGKGANQAIMAARCGVAVELVTSVGDDEPGDWILAVLAEEGVSTLHSRRCGAPTDRSVILLGPTGENAIVTTVECAAAIGRKPIRAALAEAAPGDGVLVQGNLPLETTGEVLEAAKQCSLATAFNPSPIRAGFARLLPAVDLLIVNVHEAEALSGQRDPATAAAALRAAGAGTVVVTLGAEGALAETEGGVVTVPAHRTKAVDTTGAGDTFAGVLIARWRLRDAIDAADIDAAAAAAAVTVGRRGTRSAFPTRDELAALFGAIAA